MTDTPLTDASHDAWHGNAPRDNIWSLARQLERDLAAARERSAALEEIIRSMGQEISQRNQSIAALEAERERWIVQEGFVRELRDTRERERIAIEALKNIASGCVTGGRATAALQRIADLAGEEKP